MDSLKSKILKLLSDSDADISGQSMAEKFGVSRNAVWKAVNSLKNDGFVISSVSNRGYRLVSESEKLSAEKISGNMKIKADVVVLNDVDSTNNEAKRLVAAGKIGSFVVVSNSQTNGRGRSGKDFYSPSGGLYLTVVSEMNTLLADALKITSFSALVTVKAIESVTGKKCSIKWVNDIFSDNKKVCGILTEAVSDFESGKVSKVLVGVGLNVCDFEVPSELCGVAGSLGCKKNVRNLMASRIADGILSFSKDADYISEYRKYSMMSGKHISFELDGKRQSGTAVGITEDGGLEVECENGKIVLHSGSIAFEE